ANYRGSDWVGEELSRPEALAGGPEPGDRAPDVAGLLREGLGFPLRLFDLLRGTHHTLLVYGAAPADVPGLGASGDPVGVLRQRWGDRLKAYVIAAPEVPGRGGDGCPTLVDSGRQFQRAYAAGGATAYLVRPDGYVGFRTDALRVDTLGRYLGGIFRP